MKVLIPTAIKQASLGQAITKAVKPKSYIPPLLFGLGVEFDHVFGSKWLVNEMFRVGFSVSYDEVTRFKHSVLMSKEEGIERLLCGSYTQWVADNVDHNICTIDGKDTFHGMGIIAVATRNPTQEPPASIRIPRLQSILKAKDVTSQKHFPIKWYETTRHFWFIRNHLPTNYQASISYNIAYSWNRLTMAFILIVKHQ